MTINDLISSVDSEIIVLKEVRSLLTGRAGHTAQRGRKPARKHTMSAEGRARIAAAQRKRWAAQNRAANRAA